MRVTTDSIQQTLRTGEILGSCLKGNETVCLSGEPGSGKTVFVKGLAKGLGIDECITSPTFTLVKEYHEGKTLYHFDAYRLNEPWEFYNTGVEEYLDGSGVLVVEWAERVRDILPSCHIQISITGGEHENSRVMEIEFLLSELELEFKKRLEVSD